MLKYVSEHFFFNTPDFSSSLMQILAFLYNQNLFILIEGTDV